MRKLLTGLFLFCTTLTALAGDSTEHWLEVKSPHFRVLTNSSSKQAIHIASQFEKMRTMFHTVMPNAASDANSPITVLVLKDRRDFRALEPASYMSKGALDLDGLFMQQQDKNYILLRLDAEGEHPFSVVYHEYTHFMVRNSTWLPLWLNEGLAEFYQNTDIHDKEILLGQPSQDDIYYLRQNRLLPITTLLKVDYTSPYYHEEQKGSMFYAESWALTHYLEVTDAEKHLDRVRDYAARVSRHEDSVTAAQEAFGDLNALQKKLDSYVGQGEFKMFKLNTSVTVDESGFVVRPVLQPEMDAIRADVLVSNGRAKEAETLLESSLRDDPNNALAHEVMGSLKFSEGDVAAAKKWYGEAVRLDSHSYLAHYYFAAMALQDGDSGQDDAIESSLQASIKLNPTFAPAYDALARLYASRDEKLGEAHMLNLHAVQLEPANLSYRLNAATVLSQNRQFASAVQVLKAAQEVAKTPEEIAMVQNRIGQLEKFQAAMAREGAPGAGAGAQASSGQAGTTVDAGGPEVQPRVAKTMVFRRVNGQMLGRSEDTPAYPAGDSKGARHSIQGTLRDVACSYPNVLALTVEQGGKRVTLYNNNYYKIVFTLANYTQEDEIKPCTDIEGMKASVGYAEVTDKVVAGQILTIELSK